MSYADNPIRKLEDKWLNRRSSVEALSGLLADPDLETPLAVGVYGAWGSGKTSVMNLLKAGLPQNHLTLWFDAWKYARQGMALWRALLLAVVEALGDDKDGLPKLIRESPVDPVDPQEVRALTMAGEGAAEQVIREQRIQTLRQELEELSVSLYRSQTITEQGDVRVNWKAAVPFAADMALRIATLGLSDKLNLTELVGKLTGDDAKEAMTLIEREGSERLKAMFALPPHFEGLNEDELRELVFVTEMAV